MNILLLIKLNLASSVEVFIIPVTTQNSFKLAKSISDLNYNDLSKMFRIEQSMSGVRYVTPQATYLSSLAWRYHVQLKITYFFCKRLISVLHTEVMFEKTLSTLINRLLVHFLFLTFSKRTSQQFSKTNGPSRFLDIF